MSVETRDKQTPHQVVVRSAFARIFRNVLRLAAITAVFLLGVWLGDIGSDAKHTEKPNRVTEDPEAIWTCSMHPEIRQTHPGQCPICGMDLIPVVRPQEAPKTKTVKYACSMMCIPPVDKPGKCPVCGMDMVPVEETGTGGMGDTTASVTLSPRAQKLAEVKTAPVERRFVAGEIKMFGKIDYDETRVRSISARVPGRLDRLFVNYTGVRVQKGDHLVSLYSPELLTAQEELLQAVRGIKESDAIGIPALKEAALASLAASRGKLLLWGLTQEQLDEIEGRGTASDHTTIFATIGGVVIEKQAVEGMYVEMGDRLYTIADLSHVWVKLEAYESDLTWLRHGQKVEFYTEAYPSEVFLGRIAFIDPILNAKTRTVKVRVNVANPDGRLKPEMFVRAFVRSKVATGGKVMDEALAGKWISPMHPEIVKDGPGTCDVCGMPLVTAESLGYVSANAAQVEAPLVIPASAPLITGKRAIVYLENPAQPGTYEGREIELGPRAGDYYLVKDGLREGERVVVQGNVQIDSAVQILARRSMMNYGGVMPPIGEQGAAGAPSPSSAAVATVDRIEVPPQFKLQLEGVFDTYFVIQDALSHDRFGDAQAGATRLQKALESIDMGLVPKNHHSEWLSEYARLRQSASQISAAKDLEVLRAAYEPLSNGLIVAAKKYGTSGKQPIRRYHCPMAFNNRGADWLHNKPTIENPYFGAAMFSCGVLKEVIEPGPAGKSEGGN